MTDGSIFRALRTLRDGSGDGVERAWEAIYGALKRCAGGGHRPLGVDREDAVNEAFLKVVRHVHDANPRDEAAARAWLRRIFDRTHLDLVRRRARRRELFDSQGTGSDIEGLLARIPAPEPSGEMAHERDGEGLAPYEQALWDRVDEHLETHVRTHARPNARRRAELAYDNIVRRRPIEALRAELGREVRPDTLYQWIHRGRDQVLVPVLETWQAEADPDAPAGLFVGELLTILRARVRRDAGKSRPERRKEPPVEGE